MAEIIENEVIQQNKASAFNWKMYENRSVVLNDLKERNIFVDVVLASNDGYEEAVHFPIISALGIKLTNLISKRLEDPHADYATITSEGKEMRLKKVVLNGLDQSCLKAVINCAYKGQIASQDEDIWKLLKGAEMYEIDCIINACCTYICQLITIENCCDILETGIKFNHAQLIKAAKFKIKSDLKSILAGNEAFAKISLKYLIDILNSDDLSVISEDMILSAIKKWVSFQSFNRNKHTKELLACVRYYRMSLEAINEMTKESLFKGKDISKIVQKWINEKENCRFKLDGNRVPCGVFPRQVRPRIPYSILFAYGGWNAGSPTNMFETYDVSTNFWYKNENRNGPKKAYCGIEFYNDLVYLVGGTDGEGILNTFESYNPVTKEWTTLPEMLTLRCYVSTAILDGNLYALGGHSGEMRMRTVERYNFEEKSWSVVPDMNIARSDASACVMDGKIFIVGGLNENQIEASCECYDPDLDSWTLQPNMSTPRTSLAIVAQDHFIYALGGNSGLERLNSVEKYDTILKQWSPLPDMISKRSTFSAGILNREIYVVGGYNGTNPINSVESFNEGTQTWKAVHDLEFDRSGLSVIPINGLSNMKDFTYHGQQIDLNSLDSVENITANQRVDSLETFESI